VRGGVSREDFDKCYSYSSASSTLSSKPGGDRAQCVENQTSTKNVTQVRIEQVETLVVVEF